MPDYEALAMVEANELTDDQFIAFLGLVETLPAPRANITGQGLRLLFEFMEDTGCRVTEALHVRKKDIDFRTKILTVIHPKSESTCPCSRWKYRDQYTRQRVLEYADPKCVKCHGKGKYKKPQRTTITPRIWQKLYQYSNTLKDDEVLFHASRMSVWRWGKTAGQKAGINIFQQKDNIMIEGIFPHLFRALCSKRTVALAQNDKYKDAIVACKMRHSYHTVTDRYTKISINYLISWENRMYSALPENP